MAAKKLKKEEITAKVQNKPFIMPLMSEASCDYSTQRTKTRTNAAGRIQTLDVYKNIDESFVPFKKNNRNNYSIKEIVELCQKAYYGFSSFRNVLGILEEFCISDIHLAGKNDEAKKFFTAWLKRINIQSLQGRWFREYFRSGNIFFTRLFGSVDDEFVKRISQVYSVAAKKGKYIIPLNYVVLNPSDIEVPGISFETGFSTFYKVLTPYEAERLRKPTTEDEQRIYDALPDKVKEQLKGGSTSVLIPLESKDVIVSFYKRQDYEPFAVPMGYAVLADINHKLELKKIDQAISRTVQQAVLLINVGAELKDGNLHIDQKQIEALRDLFSNESVGRTLVGDFTVKAQFIIPQISDILDPKKYSIIDNDIKNGLTDILAGTDEKFANKSLSIKVFKERLVQARKQFLNEFLIPEIKKIAKELQFKNYPEPYYQDIDLLNDIEYYKIYSRLAELGILTPEESFEAFDTGKLPSKESSLESQKEYKDQRKDGLYQPIVGSAYYQGLFAPKPQVAGAPKSGGRPSGTTAPKKVTPIGGSYSSSLLVDNMKLLGQLNAEVEKETLKFYKIKKLNDKQKEIVIEIANTIVVNEESKDWLSKAKEYVENPTDKNIERVNEIHEIAANFGIDSFSAGLLKSSEKKE